MAVIKCFLAAAAIALLLLPRVAEAGSYRRIVLAYGEVTGEIVPDYFGASNAACYDVPLFDFATMESIGRIYDCGSDFIPSPTCVGGGNVTTTFNFTIGTDSIVYRW